MKTALPTIANMAIVFASSDPPNARLANMRRSTIGTLARRCRTKKPEPTSTPTAIHSAARTPKPSVAARLMP
ncbi:MAG TPA: hypothetical protein VFE19_01715 [Jatrophihabitantaceae bacterium]|nr:hypothetical protein [Jatrophihabitantaceae bacterium]